MLKLSYVIALFLLFAGPLAQAKNLCKRLSRPDQILGLKLDSATALYLSSWTKAEARLATRKLRRLKFTDVKGESSTIAWGNIEGRNCSARAAAMGYALSMNRFDRLPATPSESAWKKILNPEHDYALVDLIDPVEFHYELILPDGTPSGLGGAIQWPAHRAVVINVEGELKAIDFSASAEPLALNEWLRFWRPHGVPDECAWIDQETWFFRVLKLKPGMPLNQKQACGYSFKPHIGFIYQDANGRTEFEADYQRHLSALGLDREALISELQNHSRPSVSGTESLYTVRVF